MTNSPPRASRWPRSASAGSTPSPRWSAGLVFATVLPDEGLTALQSKVERIARMAGADLPRRRFRPHVTLARSSRQPKGPARDRMAAALGMPVAIPGFTATEVVLYRSTLGAGGALHEPLETYPLSPF
jgi:RNA 2',3'-cyclic 3'-phosphodiesterase